MKKISVVILVLVLAVVLVIPAAAKGNGPGGNGPNSNPGVPYVGGTGAVTVYAQMQQGPRQTFAMVGTIEAIDPVLMTITINVINGNKLAQESIGELVTVSVVDSTRYLLKTGTSVLPIRFENLETGQQVSLNGIVSVDNKVETWTAYRVTVGAILTQTHQR